MKNLVRRFVFVGCIAGAGGAAACSSAPATGDRTSEGAEATGSIGARLELAPGVTISTVTWTIANAATGFAESGTVNVSASNTVAFQVGGLPASNAYSITLGAVSVDGTLSCSGSADFTIDGGVTTAVSVPLVCVGAAANTGNAAVTASTDVCANIGSLSVSLAETTVGQAVALAATASAGSVPVTFAWTASAGSFDAPSSASPVFTCPATPATVTVTVTVTPGDASCPTVTTESTTIACDALDPTFTNVYGSIIGPRCVSCHQPGKSGVTVGGLDMSTLGAAFTNLVGVPALGTGAGTSGVTCASLGANLDAGSPLLRVAPGSSAASLIVEKVQAKIAGTNPPCGSAMPLGAGAPLTSAQVALLSAWIDGGATKN